MEREEKAEVRGTSQSATLGIVEDGTPLRKPEEAGTSLVKNIT